MYIVASTRYTYILQKYICLTNLNGGFAFAISFCLSSCKMSETINTISIYSLMCYFIWKIWCLKFFFVLFSLYSRPVSLFKPIVLNPIFRILSVSLNISVLCSNLLISRDEDWRYTLAALYMDGLSVKLYFMSIADIIERNCWKKRRLL